MENPEFNKINKDAFRVPENYFESVEDRIFSRMNSGIASPEYSANEPKKNKHSFVRIISMTLLSAAACGAFFIYVNKVNEAPDFNLSNIENSEIVNYLNENAEDVDLELLVSKSNESENTFELIEEKLIKAEQDELIDDIPVEELF